MQYSIVSNCFPDKIHELSKILLTIWYDRSYNIVVRIILALVVSGSLIRVRQVSMKKFGKAVGKNTSLFFRRFLYRSNPYTISLAVLCIQTASKYVCTGTDITCSLVLDGKSKTDFIVEFQDWNILVHFYSSCIQV